MRILERKHEKLTWERRPGKNSVISGIIKGQTDVHIHEFRRDLSQHSCIFL